MKTITKAPILFRGGDYNPTSGSTGPTSWKRTSK